MSRYGGGGGGGGGARVWIVTTQPWDAADDMCEANGHLATGRDGHDYDSRPICFSRREPAEAYAASVRSASHDWAMGGVSVVERRLSRAPTGGVVFALDTQCEDGR